MTAPDPRLGEIEGRLSKATPGPSSPPNDSAPLLLLRRGANVADIVGYVVIEYNQASGQPSIPMASEVESLEDAKVTKLYYEGVARKTGRRERYAIGTVTTEEESE